MLSIFYDPGEHTESVVRHGSAWAESLATPHPGPRIFGVQGLSAEGRYARNPFRQR